MENKDNKIRIRSKKNSMVAQTAKNLPANAGDPSLIPGLGRSPRERNSSPFRYSHLENSTDRGI